MVSTRMIRPHKGGAVPQKKLPATLLFKEEPRARGRTVPPEISTPTDHGGTPRAGENHDLSGLVGVSPN
jgi:hypothetical protein